MRKYLAELTDFLIKTNKTLSVNYHIDDDGVIVFNLFLNKWINYIFYLPLKFLIEKALCDYNYILTIRRK